METIDLATDLLRHHAAYLASPGPEARAHLAERTRLLEGLDPKQRARLAMWFESLAMLFQPGK